MKFCAQAFPGTGGSHAVLVAVPEASWPGVRALMDKSAEKHNNYLTLDVSLPHKPRSTGPKSQSAHLHGHLQQLGRHLGYSMEEIKSVMKYDCIEWPRHQITFKGQIYLVPISEADASSAVESAAIEWCHMRSAEFAIMLVEE